MKIQPNKKLNKLSKFDLEYVFNSAFPKIPKEVDEIIIAHEEDYVLITKLGCTLVLFSDYSIEVFSNIMPIREINLVNITNSLIDVRALKIEKNEK
jgi:hypothetical protein